MNHDLTTLLPVLAYAGPVLLFGFYVLGREAWKGFWKYCNAPPVLSEREEKIDKQIADLETAVRRTGRGSRTISVKCQRLDRRVKKLEKLNKGEKQ